jgi:hypothetical protein
MKEEKAVIPHPQSRPLIVALWRYLQTGTVPEGAVLKA